MTVISVINQKGQYIVMNGSIDKEMVPIPAGAFIMGSDWETFYGTTIPESMHARRDETPIHVAHLNGYRIDRHPVTNGEYARFVEATRTSPPRHWKNGICPTTDLNLPVVNITWQQAQAYATWIGKRLPTEAEWEKAARGFDGRLYPWGNEFAVDKCSSLGKSHDTQGLEGTPIPHIEPVGSHPDGASPYGVEDMAGNVWEWTADHYQAYPNSKFQIKESEQEDHVIRGGSWKEVHDRTPHLYFRCATRWHVPPRYSANNIGFRCARDLTADEAARYTRQIDMTKLREHLRAIKRDNLEQVMRLTSRAAFRDGILSSMIVGLGLYAMRTNEIWIIGFTIVTVGVALLFCAGINLWRYFKARRHLYR